MEVNKRSGEKRGGMKLGLGGLGGGGFVVVVGGALVAATVWSFCEFRRRKKPSCKKGSLKDFQTPNLENVAGEDGLGLQNSKNPFDFDESQTEGKDTTAQNLLLDEEKKSKLGITEEEEEIHEMTHGVEFCADSVDDGTLSSVSEDELSVSEEGMGEEAEDNEIILVEKMEEFQFTTPEIRLRVEKTGDEVVQCTTSYREVNDGRSDAVSKNHEYEGKDGCERRSRETSDSSTESYVKAAWAVESSEAQPQEEKHTGIQSEIVELDESKTRSIVNGIHHKESYDNNISIHKQKWGSLSKDKMMLNSTDMRIWVSTVLLALLVLLGALLAQHKYSSPALADHLSSISAFLMK